MEYFQTFKNRLDNCHWGILGGVVRSYIERKPPRDIDIIYQGNPDFSGLKCSINHFGGRKIQLSDYEIDIWPIEIHFAFREKFYDIDFSNISKTALVSSDSLLYDVTLGKLYSRDFRISEHTNELLINQNKDYLKKALSVEPDKMISKILKSKYSNKEKVADYFYDLLREKH